MVSSRAPRTYYKYRCISAHLEPFIRNRYGCFDLLFDRLDREYLIGFHQDIANDRVNKTKTVWIYLIAFKHILMFARSQGLGGQNLFDS